ncbi:hypothetical protein [Candidatus Thioglobus sp.]|jgi:hypothetical protein|uniref:hypothetical protein n=1 Tax=Candidatus Thioglobus sp. TaxID=2026721 RepID=UPI002604A327|nr:hypothetical protein [Candidatus Thioglobus sp.]
MKSFANFVNEDYILDEATIVNQKTYGAGHKLVVRATANKEIKSHFSKEVELAGETADVEELQIGKGTESVFIKDGKKITKVIGSTSTLNSSFNHAGGGKSDTHRTTRCKEALSLIVFKHWHESGSVIEEEAAIALLPKWDAETSVYKTVYYTSALLQLKSFKKIKQMKAMIFEFQGDTFSAKIYAKAKMLGAPSKADNWNPADLWLFNKAFASTMASELKEIKFIDELNHWIRRNYSFKNIVPISLKQATGSSSIELIEPIKYQNKTIEYDLRLKRVIIAGTTKSVFVESVSGFTFKANARSSAGNPTLFFEGTMAKENFAMGAIDKSTWNAYSKGAVPNASDIKPTKALMKSSLKTFKKYKGEIVQKNNDNLWNPDFESMDVLAQRRYITCADFLKFIMESYDDTMKFGFFASMKVSKINSMYLKIK